MNFDNKKKGIINKHFLTSLILFLGVLIVALTFISFLEDAQDKDKLFVKIGEKDNYNLKH